LEKHFLYHHNKNVVVQLRLRFGGINNLWLFRMRLFGIITVYIYFTHKSNKPVLPPIVPPCSLMPLFALIIFALKRLVIIWEWCMKIRNFIEYKNYTRELYDKK
jgi:hypothetical protein